MFSIVAAISLGLLGSFHCIGMCGPIALALPVHQATVFRKVVAILLYNSGRIITYSLLGLLFGIIGQGFAVFGLQQVLSVSLGTLILLSIILPKKFVSRFSVTNKLSYLFGKLKSGLSNLFSKRNLFSLFSIGILNGLLPCGLVYMAIAGAVATGKMADSVLFMAFFGLGTVPVMLSLSWFSNLVSMKFRNGITRTMPYLVSVMAILMILRGLNLGIPYISPSYHQDDKTVSCCEKPMVNNADAKEEVMECCHKK
ncbi:MAG: sulfite exporter TauE/SafE family protein [Bacteroidia bacterium]